MSAELQHNKNERDLLRLIKLIGDESNNYGNDEDDGETARSVI
jgi:hypothetical protein